MPEEVDEVKTGVRFGTDDDPHELGEEVGSGAVARVYSCRRINTGELLAAKVINLQRLRLLGDFEIQMVKLNREVQILRELHHPRIVNLHSVHKTTNWCFLVMEHVRGGELFNQIVQQRTLNEVEARYIFRQVLEGLGYMHSRHVIHRDLKPENILIAASQPAPPPMAGKLHDVKIADFGLSKIIKDSTSFAKTFVGTPQYWAPEVLNVQRGGGSYDQAADFWSLGAVLFVMLCGRYPFDGKKMPLEEQIQTASFNMNTNAWHRISEEAKDLVRGLLKVKPTERFTLQHCLRHPWVMGTGSYSPQIIPQPPAMIITEVSASPQGNNTNTGPAPMVTQPSMSSDLSGNSGSSQSQDQQAKVKGTDSAGWTSANQVNNQVPRLNVNDEPTSPTDQETIFCLNELLKLQVSIAGSLEMACLAFRHADRELSDCIRRTFYQARDLSQHAVNVVSKYSQVAQQVSQTVLPDLNLAVQEKEPSLAVSLLGMVKGWVANMKTDGETIQVGYMELQDSVHKLIRRAQHTKSDADRRLAEAVQVMETEMPQTSAQGFLALGQPAPENATIQAQPVPTECVIPDKVNDEVQNDAMDGVTPAPNPDHGTLNVPFSMNQSTKQLFEQLNVLQDRTEQASKDKTSDPHKPDPLEDEHWKQDVLELLFMAPGMTAAQLPKVEPFVHSTAPPELPGSPGCSKDQQQAASRETNATTPSSRGTLEDAVVMRSYGSAKATAEAMTHSSASLLRALRELKRVDEILQGCSAFWANLDSTVQKLAQMKEHTECLVNFAGNSQKLRERFEQRLMEYGSFWSSLERLCRQYCLDHQATTKKIYDVIRDVGDATDMMDTAQSARLGMMAALREKQRMN